MLFDHLLSLVAPHECLGCNAEGALLCSDCQTGLRPAVPCCYKCQAPSPGFKTCLSCRPSAPLSAVYSVARYSDVAKDIVWKLKFGRAPAGASEVAQIIVDRLRLRQLVAGRRTGLVVTHAPTAPSRARQRGYDQAALIARSLARGCGLPYHPLLRRHGNQKQMGANRAQRALQLTHAFYATRIGSIKDAHVILVDDVVTTGATLEAAARVLMEAGARRVDAVVFAQA